MRLMTYIAARAIEHAFSRDPDVRIGPEGDPYMERWHWIPRNRLFNVYIHMFHHSDDDRALHDHPWWSLSYALRGEMIEVFKTRKGEQRQRWLFPHRWVFRSGKFAHRLILPENENPPMTIFVTGPRFRMWGFHCPKGWVPFWKFVDKDDSSKTGGGCGEFE